MGNFDKFRLLMWKNFLLQWRHPKQTVVEIITPVLFSSLLVVLRSLVDPEEHAAMMYLPFQNSLGNVTDSVTTIAWCPYSPVLERIMNDTITNINAKNGTNLKSVWFEDGYSMEQYLNNELNLITTLAGVQFDNVVANSSVIGTNMDVTLRFPAELRSKPRANWRTNLLFPVYQVPGPREWKVNEGAQPSYYLEGFLMLQQELSYSIIKYYKQQVSGSPYNSEQVAVSMQRFPYPKWVEDNLLTALQAFIGLIIMLSFVYTCISTVKVITAEKEKQLKEAMKIMGLPNWLHWTAWFIKCLGFLLITITIMIILMKVQWYPGTDHTVFTESNPLVIFLFLLFFICSTITFCFLISVFFSKANTAATIAGLAWFLSYFPYTFTQDVYDTLSLSKKLSASLCSNTAMAYGFQLILMFEGIGEGIQWHNIWKTTTPDDNLTLGHLMVMLLVDTFIYLFIAIYIEAVFPGEYGVPQKWYFPFTKAYWCGKTQKLQIEGTEEDPEENEFYEREPTHLQAGIKIHHLRKEFPNKKIAVRDLCLNMYEDQITALLGHNGAGKTTTMSMLTGMFPPTSGTAIVGGYDIRTNIEGVRESLGLCPQHNILFDELTVKEHLYFYSRLKGLDNKLVDEEISKYVDLLELQPKKNSQSSTLSGGMKRKLSVGVALCGNSSVVMLDEPTAGMDPAARRALWDLLQSQKKGRTILLTTHFMDEADLLGDRIAIMAGGKLQCCGSSFFLKKKYGAGYHLIMDKTQQCRIDLITSLLQKYIPNIQVESNIGSELTYLLNEEYSSVFEKMLSELEINAANMGVLSYGVSLTTLEEVFMKVGADHGQEEENDAVENRARNQTSSGYTEVSQIDPNPDGSANVHEALNRNVTAHITVNVEDRLLTGWSLWFNQIQAMFMKRGLSILRSWVLFAVQNLIPVMFLVLALVVNGGSESFKDLPEFKIDLDAYDDPVTVLTRTTFDKYSEMYTEFLRNQSKEYLDWGGENMTSKMLTKTESNPTAVRLQYIAGATFDQSVTAWFNNDPYHSPPLALQLVMNSILKQEVSPEYNLNFYNHPLPFRIQTKLTQLIQGNNVGFRIAFNVGFSMAFVSAFYVMFYIRERICKAKHLQFVSGISVVPFWSTAFICDLLTFIFTSVCLIITLVCFQEDGFKTAEELGRVFSVLLYFGFSMLPMMYLASFCFEIPSTGYTRMALVNIFTGVAAFLVIQILSQPDLDLENTANILHWIFLLIPHYSLSTGLRDLNFIYSTHKLCNTIIDMCQNTTGLPQSECKLAVCMLESSCCTTTENYFDIEAPGIGRNVIFSCCVGVILIAILLGIEYRLFEKIRNKIRKNKPPPSPTADTKEDSDVLQEKLRIKNATMEEITQMNLVMRDVTKYYDEFLAVNSICLGVGRYECFGLLGVNGAGKTTTFKMMTGDIDMSSGDAWVTGLSLKTDMKKIYQLVGYCPQFDALLDDLTSRETLVIFGLLRGVSVKESTAVAERLAHEFDFYRHMDKKVKELSGGNKRKLSTAIALIGDPLVIYLDEPTTGMDPATKRYLWNALCKVRDQGKCIVLTSHSMEECEALCTRLAIMVNGTFKCIGSTQHLKTKFSDGYTLMIKVQRSGDTGELENSEIEPIETFVKQNFRGAVIREKHQELITFYIAEKVLPWSRMFGIMERAKRSLSIEDYSLGQCSLEQVFLTFTKHQRDE